MDVTRPENEPGSASVVTLCGLPSLTRPMSHPGNSLPLASPVRWFPVLPLMVLLSAVAFNRVGFGLFLIVTFSAGLAAVLIAVGHLVVYARKFVTKLPRRWTVSSALVTIDLGCCRHRPGIGHCASLPDTRRDTAEQSMKPGSIRKT